MIYRLILFLIIFIILFTSIGIGTGMGTYMTFSIDRLKQVQQAQQYDALLQDK